MGETVQKGRGGPFSQNSIKPRAPARRQAHTDKKYGKEVKASHDCVEMETSARHRAMSKEKQRVPAKKSQETPRASRRGAGSDPER